jgi:hypothetical protein
MDRENLASQLYDTLGKIGTRRRSIKPLVLEEYPLLFGCPKVYGGATSQDKSLLAEDAYSALLEAIEAIPDRTDRLVAEGILAIGPFEGKGVNERIREIEATSQIGCSADSYKRRRPRVLRAIVQFLMRETVKSSFNHVQPDTRSTVIADTSALNVVARVTSELHYRALTTLFVADFASQVQKSASGNLESLGALAGYRQGKTDVWHACSEALFPIYLDFVAETRYCLRTYRKEILDTLSRSELADLAKLCRTCAACGPVALYDLTDDEYDWYMERLWGNALPQRGVDYKLSLPPGYEFYDDRKISFESPLPGLYVTAWLPWYEANSTVSPEFAYRRPFAEDPPSGFADNAPVSAIELMVAKTSAIYELIGSRFGLELPLRALARRQAERDIVNYYTVDDWLPLFRGKSLKVHVEEFLDEKATELAKPELVWFDSTC